MSHPVNQLFYVLGVLFLFLILMEAINLIANDKVKVVDGRVETEEFDTEE